MMAETATRPAKARKSTKATAAPKAAATDETVARTVLELVPAGETKTYAKFNPPAGSGCVGTFYAPLGTTEVRVALLGPASE